MFMLVIALCSGIVGTPSERCEDYVIDGPLTVYDCGQAIAQHAVKNELAEFRCLRMVRPGEDWHAKHDELPKK